ncbi:MAG: DEAD/DEAH box helicase [Bacillota bacterium]
MIQFQKSYLYDALNGLNFQSLSPIQEKVIPNAQKGRDVIAASETGTGKSHAFLLPVFDALKEEDERVQSVILVPTRDLATQILEMARTIASYCDKTLDIRAFTGGKDREREIARLKKSQPQIVIGTPGKVHDLTVKENVLKIHTAKMLIIDEADMALEIGFLTEMEAVASILKDAQFMVFSATIPKVLRDFLKKSMHQPYEVDLGSKGLTRLPINHKFLKVEERDEFVTLDKLLDALNPYLAIVFANTKGEVDLIASHMHQKNLEVTKLHGDLTQRERKQVLRDIDKLRVQYIVASDIAARGIDIDGISHVINMAFPKDMSFYIHRAGRTGRMGRSGEVITLYKKSDTDAFSFLMKENIPLEFVEVKEKTLKPVKSDPAVLKSSPSGRKRPKERKEHHANPAHKHKRKRRS